MNALMEKQSVFELRWQKVMEGIEPLIVHRATMVRRTYLSLGLEKDREQRINDGFESPPMELDLNHLRPAMLVPLTRSTSGKVQNKAL
jgi:hypothetical protein